MLYLAIVSVGAFLFGGFIYWRESRNNSLYRRYNKLINKKDLQMKSSDRKGFFFLRNLPIRVLNSLLITGFFVALLYYVPYMKINFELVLDFFLFFLIGTYVAAALPTVKDVVDNPMDTLQKVGEAGKTVVSDIAGDMKVEKEVPSTQENASSKADDAPEAPKESARDRMKRKGYLK